MGHPKFKLFKKKFNTNIIFLLKNKYFLSKMDSMSSENASYQAGQVKGETKEKASSMAESVSNTAQSVKESCQEAASQMQAKASGAMEAVKESMSTDKSSNQ